MENCTDVGTGYNLGYATAGEWLEYTVNVTTAGKYNLVLRAACNGDARTVDIQANGVTVAPNVAIPNTTGWQIWQDVTVKDVTLTAGIQVIRVTIGATDYVNLNYMTFAPASTPPTVSISAPVANAEFTTNQKITITATAASATGTIASVKFYAGTTLLNTDESAPYSYEWSGMAVGSYSITAVATDNSGATTTSTAVAVKVNAAPLSIKLKAGWNLIGCPIDGSTNIETALASIWSNVLVVKNMEAFYDKSQATMFNTLLKLDWGKGYLVKVNAACELTWK
ncbi:MAG: carbohydrate-binding protein [Bacteroidales bacterium]|nr:carbohydrate-binding protein [Bacteroidales bacterium]